MERITENSSQSNLWRMDILISVGASEYGFDRLLKIIDELCDENILNGEKIIAQLGSSHYKPHSYKYFELVSRDEYQNYMDNADIIISHAGTGSVIPPLKMGKKVIVFPRLEQFGEHLDDHQLELAEVFTQGGYTLCANDKDELKSCLLKIDEFHPKTFKSNNANMNKLIIDFIEESIK